MTVDIRSLRDRKKDLLEERKELVEKAQFHQAQVKRIFDQMCSGAYDRLTPDQIRDKCLELDDHREQRNIAAEEVEAIEAEKGAINEAIVNWHRNLAGLDDVGAEEAAEENVDAEEEAALD